MVKNKKSKDYPESIGKFSIENFRVFETETEFDFRPVTFLVGPNSSGKSSLMKLLKTFSNITSNSWQTSFVPNSLSSNLSEQSAMNIDFKRSRPLSDKPFTFKIDSVGLFGVLGLNYTLCYGSSSGLSSGTYLSLIEIRRKNDLIISIKPHDSNSYLITFSIQEFLSLSKDYLSSTSESISNAFKKLPKREDGDKLFKLNDLPLNNLYVSKLTELENTCFCDKNAIIEIDSSKFFMEEQIYLQRQISFDELGDNGLKGFFQFIILGGYQQFFLQELEKLGFDGKIGQTSFGDYLLNEFSNEIQKDLTFTIGKNLDFAHTPVFKRERERVFNINDTKLTTFDLLLKSYIIDHLAYFENGILLSNDYIDKWLVKFGIGKSLIITKMEPDEQYFFVEIEKDDGKKLNISDLGYGAGQVLAYLLLPYFSNIPSYHYLGSFNPQDNKATIMQNNESVKRKVTFNDMLDANGKKITQNVYLEEPETNLHPNWQSILAELIVFQISIGIRFVIETHSEYLIRKIQNLTALKQCDKNDVVIYYFNSEKERKQKKIPTTFKINLNDNGTLSESFGPGFFDEAGKLSLELLSLNSIIKN